MDNIMRASKELSGQMDVDRHNAKIIAVEDVMKKVKWLAGCGQYPGYEESPGKIFDFYYSMSMEDLHKESESLESVMCKYIQSIHPKIKSGEGNINRVLGDDEQDFDDNDDLKNLF